MKYAAYTRNTRDPIKRIAHGKRFAQAAAIIEINAGDLILDYGCGDGAFFDTLVKYVPAHQLTGYEPYLLDQLEFEGATTYSDLGELMKGNLRKFDRIFCMEVCEHLSYERMFEAFQAIHSLAKPDARIVFGVPLETGPSGFMKNVYRTLKGGVQNATFGKAVKSLFGIPISRACAPRGWIGSHVGFDAQVFSEHLRYGGFSIEEMHFLPFKRLRGIVNNEVYFVCKICEPS